MFVLVRGLWDYYGEWSFDFNWSGYYFIRVFIVMVI